MLAYFFLVNWCIFDLRWEVFEGEFDGQFIFFSEVWAALNKLLRGHEPWQPPSSHGIHVKKKAKMRHTWRSTLVLYRLKVLLQTGFGYKSYRQYNWKYF